MTKSSAPPTAKKEKMIDVPFSENEILILHAVASLGDGRTAMVKLMRKRISPVALPLLQARRLLDEKFRELKESDLD